MAETKRPRLDEAGEGPVEAPEEDGLENLDDPTVQALHEADALQQQLEQVITSTLRPAQAAYVLRVQLFELFHLSVV